MMAKAIFDDGLDKGFHLMNWQAKLLPHDRGTSAGIEDFGLVENCYLAKSSQSLCINSRIE